MMAGLNGETRIAFNVFNAAVLWEKSAGNEVRTDIVALPPLGVLVSNLA